ncbi:hypothetical protein KKH18_12540 [bacterium]|nr:hypothetical protein [bacterium]
MNMISIPRPTISFDIELLRFAVETDYLDYVMPSLGKAITAAKDRIESAKSSGPTEYFDAVVDEECALVEDLLGISFVSCQTKIYKVTSYLVKVHDRLGLSGKSLCKKQELPNRIMGLDERAVAGKPITRIQLIHAAANYFKHHAEWKHFKWSKLTGHALKTVATLRCVGIRRNTGILRNVARVLGNSEFHNTLLFSGIVDEWAADALVRVEKELQKKC